MDASPTNTAASRFSVTPPIQNARCPTSSPSRRDPGRDRRAVRDGPGAVDPALVGAARRADGDGGRGLRVRHPVRAGGHLDPGSGDGGLELPAHRRAVAAGARLRRGRRDGRAPRRPRHVRLPEPGGPARRRPVVRRDALHAVRQLRQDAGRRARARDRLVRPAPHGSRLERDAARGGADRRRDDRRRHGGVARPRLRAVRSALDAAVLGLGADQPAAHLRQRGGAVPRVPAARARCGARRARLRVGNRGGRQRARVRAGPRRRRLALRAAGHARRHRLCPRLPADAGASRRRSSPTSR